MAKALPVLVCVHALAAVLSRGGLGGLGLCGLGGDMSHAGKDLTDLVIAGHIDGGVVQAVQEVRVGPGTKQQGEVVGLTEERGQVQGTVSSTPCRVDLLSRGLVNQELNLLILIKRRKKEERRRKKEEKFRPERKKEEKKTVIFLLPCCCCCSYQFRICAAHDGPVESIEACGVLAEEGHGERGDGRIVGGGGRLLELKHLLVVHDHLLNLVHVTPLNAIKPFLDWPGDHKTKRMRS